MRPNMHTAKTAPLALPFSHTMNVSHLTNFIVLTSFFHSHHANSSPFFFSDFVCMCAAVSFGDGVGFNTFVEHLEIL